MKKKKKKGSYGWEPPVVHGVVVLGVITEYAKVEATKEKRKAVAARITGNC